MSDKIIPNVSTYNFDYRVIRHIEDWGGEGKATVIGGELDTYLVIQEVHYGSDGEIVAYTDNHEKPYGSDLAEIDYEIGEYLEALTKPIINYEFLKQQTELSSLKWEQEYAAEKAARTTNEDEYQNEHKVTCVSAEDVFERLKVKLPTRECITNEEAIKRFKLDEYDPNDTLKNFKKRNSTKNKWYQKVCKFLHSLFSRRYIDTAKKTGE